MKLIKQTAGKYTALGMEGTEQEIEEMVNTLYNWNATNSTSAKGFGGRGFAFLLVDWGRMAEAMRRAYTTWAIRKNEKNHQLVVNKRLKDFLSSIEEEEFLTYKNRLSIEPYSVGSHGRAGETVEA